MTTKNTGKSPFRNKTQERELTPEEIEAFRGLLKTSYVDDVAKFIGCTRQTVNNISIRGTGAPTTISKIREAINVSA